MKSAANTEKRNDGALIVEKTDKQCYSSVLRSRAQTWAGEGTPAYSSSDANVLKLRTSWGFLPCPIRKQRKRGSVREETRQHLHPLYVAIHHACASWHAMVSPPTTIAPKFFLIKTWNIQNTSASRDLGALLTYE